jgi:hypothetical protein
VVYEDYLNIFIIIACDVKKFWKTGTITGTFKRIPGQLCLSGVWCGIK